MRGPALSVGQESSFSEERLQKARAPVFPVATLHHRLPIRPSRAALWSGSAFPLRSVCHGKDQPWPPPQSQTWPVQMGEYIKYVQKNFSYSRYILITILSLGLNLQELQQKQMEYFLNVVMDEDNEHCSVKSNCTGHSRRTL